MDQACDDPDAELFQPSQSYVMPAPVARVRAVRSDRLPYDRIANCSYPKRCYPIEIVEPMLMTRLDQLVSEPVGNAGDGAFHTAPKCEASD
jgi:hypothetical protein